MSAWVAYVRVGTLFSNLYFRVDLTFASDGTLYSHRLHQTTREKYRAVPKGAVPPDIARLVKLFVQYEVAPTHAAGLRYTTKIRVVRW